MQFFRRILSRFQKKDGIFFMKIQQLLGFAPKNLRYYEEAFTHPSQQNKGIRLSYERLEFLGDAVLGAIVSDYLFHQAPLEDEGYLTKMRSKIVHRNHLNIIGKKLQLRSYLKAETMLNRLGDNVDGNLFEALIGAIYIDVGYDKAAEFIRRVLINSDEEIKGLEDKIISYKSFIIEWGQKNKRKLFFETEEENLGVKTDKKYFVSTLYLDEKVFAKSRETSKKRAEEKAARRAFFKIQGKAHSF